MPLVRYELRSELKLANPHLYRTASKDDSEAVLEGVAMAALVGIVRQLGDLAEFAAEIFNDLHDEVMAIMGCCQELGARVSTLEMELPGVERSLVSEAAATRVHGLIYSPGADWHASLPSNNNHCTRGDLPGFLRNLYDNCRGPPRLFLLDKFDAEGDGACVKRYTNPSVFMKLWAESELKKAEQQQQKARTERKEAKLREKTMEPITDLDTKPRERYSVIHLGNLEGFSGSFIPATKADVTVIQGLDQILESEEDGDQTPPLFCSSSATGSRSEEEEEEDAQTPPSLTPFAVHGCTDADVEAAEDVEDDDNGFARMNPSREEDGDPMCLLQHTSGSTRFAEEEEEDDEAQIPPLVDIGIDDMGTKEAENPEAGNFASSTMWQEKETDDEMLPPLPPLRLTTSSRSAEEAEEAQPPSASPRLSTSSRSAEEAPLPLASAPPLAIDNSMDIESRNSENDSKRPSHVDGGDDVKLQEEEKEEEEEEDGYSDNESFADALTTMDSDGESDTETKARLDPEGLSDSRVELVHDDSNVVVVVVEEPSLLEHDEPCCRPGVASPSHPCMPLGDLAQVGSSDHHHGSLSPEVVVVAVVVDNVATDRPMSSSEELEVAELPSKVELSQEVKQMPLLETTAAVNSFVNLPTLKKHTESQRQSLLPKEEEEEEEDMYLGEEQGRPGLSTEEPHETLRESEDQAASLENDCSAWEKHVDSSPRHGPFQATATDLVEQTFPHVRSIRPHRDSRSSEPSSSSSSSSSPQQEQPPPSAVRLTATTPSISLGNLGEDEGNNGNNDGMTISLKEGNLQHVSGVPGLESGSSADEFGPDLCEEVTAMIRGGEDEFGADLFEEAMVTVLQGEEEESLLRNQSGGGPAKHMESRRQRRRWDINWVEEQARLCQWAVEPEEEEDAVIESPDEQRRLISSMVNVIEPQLFLEYQGKIVRGGNSHEARPTNDTTDDDKAPVESRGQGGRRRDLTNVLGALVPTEAHVWSCHAAPKKPVESRQQRPSKSMHLEQAVYQCMRPPKKQQLEDEQPHSMTRMFTDSPIFPEYLGREREKGDTISPITCRNNCTEVVDEASPPSLFAAPPPPLTYPASKKQAESRRQRPRWDINHIKRRLVLTEMRLEEDLVPLGGSSSEVANTEEQQPDSLVEAVASEPLTMPLLDDEDGVPRSPFVDGCTWAVVISRDRITDDREADCDSPEVSEPPPPMCLEEVGVAAHSPAVNDQVVLGELRMENAEEKVPRASPEVSDRLPTILAEEVENENPPRRKQIMDGDRESDCKDSSPDVEELILLHGPCSSSSSSSSATHDAVAVGDMDQGEEEEGEKRPHEHRHYHHHHHHHHHNGIVQQHEPKNNTLLPSLSSLSPYVTDLSSRNLDDEDPDGLDDSLSSSSSSSSSIHDWPIQSWSIWSRQAHLLSPPPASPVRRQLQQQQQQQQLIISPQVSSSTHSNQISDAEMEEEDAHIDVGSQQQHGILKEMSVIDISQVQDNQNVLELNRKQYHRWRRPRLQNRWGSSPVASNDFNVAAIMEKANAIRQDIVGGSEEDEEEKEDCRNDQHTTSSSSLLNLLATPDSKNLGTPSRVPDRTGL